MDAKQFREFGYAAIDFVADYMENVHHMPVLPSVEPGYLEELLSTKVPEKPENWKDVMEDFLSKIIPGLTHWQSNNFHAYFLSQASYPSIVGDMISTALCTLSLNWMSGPAVMELEVIVLDYLAKFLDLPEFFLSSSNGNGGGILQDSASEAMLVAILAAREDAVNRFKIVHPNMSESDIRGKLVMYTSEESNCCVEKTARLAAVTVRLLSVDVDFSLRGETLQAAIEEDYKDGKFPFACVATLGTTGLCAFDNLLEIGPICRENRIWLHVDAAYAGAALCCPELRSSMLGIEYSDSFNFNLHKWMMVNVGSSVIWYRNIDKVAKVLAIHQTYLQHSSTISSKMPDYRHLEIPLGHRFHALKVWFTLRILGAEKIQEHIRRHVRLARRFAKLIGSDPRFEIVCKQSMGLVCFRLRAGCEYTDRLSNILTERKRIYMVRAHCRDQLIIRFVVNGLKPNESDIDYAWNEIEIETNKIYEIDGEEFKNGNCVDRASIDYRGIESNLIK